MTESAKVDHWSSDMYQQHANFVPQLTGDIQGHLQHFLNPASTRLLDLGCGDGVLTLELQNKVAHVTGIDASPAMIAKAQELGVKDARVVDGHDVKESLSKSGELGTYDVVFSNAALHWMKTDPLKVAEGAHAALKPSGAFIGEFGGHLNVAEVHSACINTINKFLAREPVNGADGQPVDGVKLSPWYFPDIDEYRSVLEKAGFEVKHISLTPRITPLPSDVAGWLKTFAGPFMQVLSSDEEKDQFVNEVQEMLRPVCCRNGKWSIMYNRMRFVAIKV